MTQMTLISETMDKEDPERYSARYSHLPVSVHVAEVPCYFCSAYVSRQVVVLCTGAD